jgi:uncharacterized protein YjbJ (UPF0337 family)
VIDQAKGAAKETRGNAKDAAQQVQESRKEAAAEKADGTRGKISQSIEDVKEKVLLTGLGRSVFEREDAVVLQRGVQLFDRLLSGQRANRGRGDGKDEFRV